MAILGVSAAAITAGAALLGAGTATVSAIDQRNKQKDSLRKQGAAQDEAEAQASRQERQAMEAQQRAARQTPDLMATYDREQRRRGAGAPSLTGTGNTMLGGNSALGV